MRRILLLVTLFASVSLFAEDFKILFLNTESIKIGKTVRTTGDTFNDSEKIFWKDGKQAMKVISLDTQKQYVLVSEDFKQRKLKSVKDFIVKNYRLSTRGTGSLTTVANQVGPRVYWFDPTLIDITYEPDNGEYFLMTIEEHDAKLEMVEGQLILDSSIWGDIDPHPTEADLHFVYPDGERELVSQGILLIPLPKEVRLKKR